MFQPHKKGSAVFLNAHFPPPPSAIRDFESEAKRTAKKLANKNIISTQRKAITKPISAKEAKTQLKWLNELQIPSLQSALQAVNYQKENDARVLNGTIGELLKTLNVKQAACKMKDDEIKRLKETTISLTREFDKYRQYELSEPDSGNQKDTTMIDWDRIECEMEKIHCSTSDENDSSETITE